MPARQGVMMVCGTCGRLFRKMRGDNTLSKPREALLNTLNEAKKTKETRNAVVGDVFYTERAVIPLLDCVVFKPLEAATGRIPQCDPVQTLRVHAVARLDCSQTSRMERCPE